MITGEKLHDHGGFGGASHLRAGRVRPARPQLTVDLAALPRGAVVHLHLDCGLARDGAEPAIWPALCAAAHRAQRPGRIRVVAVMGHLSSADAPDDPANRIGRATFEAAFALGDRVLVEDVVAGREVDLAVIGRPDGSRLVAPALEIVLESGLFDHGTKYDGRADLRVPADLTDAEHRSLETAAIAMYDGLGCAGLARIDFFLTADGPVLNEVNTMPGFTEQSQAPKMFAAAGTGYVALLDLLVRDVLTEKGVVT